MNLSFLELFENKITENAEDEYVAKHKTGYISPKAYSRAEEPGGLGGRSVAKCPKVIGTMTIKPVDGLSGTHKSGKTYKEIFDLVKKVKGDVSRLKEGDGLEFSESYPKWFKDVHFQYNGEWYTLRQKSDNEISDRGYLNNLMARHILWDVLKIEHIIEDGIMDREDGGGESQITFRQTGEKSHYVRTDAEGDVVRDSDGNSSYFTDEEMLAKGYPIEDDTVYAFDGPNCIGYASNEFGAVGIFVERNYQRQGIGKELLRLYLSQFKREKQLGQMTPAGEQLARSYYRTHVAGKGITESSDSVIIGCTNRDFSSRSRTIPAGSFSRDDMFNHYTHENLKLDDDFNWRYRPDTRTLYWWTPPVDEEYTAAVIAYIKKKTGSEPLRQKDIESELSLAHGLKNPVKESILSEDLINRLKWVVNNEKNPITAFLTLDAVISNRPSYASDIRKGSEQVADDIRYLANNDYDPNVPETNTLTDAQVLEKLKQMLDEWLSTGKWYDDSVIPDRSPVEKLVGWVHNWMRKGIEATNEIKTFIRFKNEIADWFMATRPNIMSLKPSQAAARSHRWHAAMARKDAERIAIEGTKHLKKVAELGDGVEIYELTVDDLKDEGAAMKHCIGRMPRYTDGMKLWAKNSSSEYGSGNRAFSVRRNGKRLYTVYCHAVTQGTEAVGGGINHIEQFKAKANRIPGQKGTDIAAAVAAKRWFRSEGYYVNCSDLHILALDESLVEELLAEMPISKLELIGDWSPGAKPRGYDKPSIGIVTSPAGVEKIKQKWLKVNEEFDIYLVRSSKGYKHSEVGEVSPQWVHDNLGIDLEYDDDKVTMIYTSNRGSEKVPMTPWTLAHRFAHACQRNSWSNKENPFNGIDNSLTKALTQIAQVVYGIGRFHDPSASKYSFSHGGPKRETIFRSICQNLGTMKSCRDRNLRNYTEFIFEMLAQYMITGRVVLNRNLDKTLVTSFAWGNPSGHWHRNLSPEQRASIDEIISSLETDAENYAYETLRRATGRIYVM